MRCSSRGPPKSRRRLTLDNGKEFAPHEAFARATVLAVLFAHPDHSWERGTNENTNGLIRRRHPKPASLAGSGPAELQRIDTYLNDRPRKGLGWQTPREKLPAFLDLAPCGTGRCRARRRGALAGPCPCGAPLRGRPSQCPTAELRPGVMVFLVSPSEQRHSTFSTGIIEEPRPYQ